MTPLFAQASFDFGYPWWLSYGHLTLLIPAGILLFLAFRKSWPKWATGLLAALVLWSGSAFLTTRFALNVNGLPVLPTDNFFRAGKGRILDLGAGTGRSSVMVLRARPEATLVALDLFAQSYETHFGKDGSPHQRLLNNLTAAGVDQRATIETADMRKLPFERGTFDAAVSAYAVDHLNREGITSCLSETARVLKPGGEFLLILVENERWAKLAFGPLLSHGATRGAEWWHTRLAEAGFEVLEAGTKPMTLYLLAKSR